jgi:membrane associated rhomboid family serine protease
LFYAIPLENRPTWRNPPWLTLLLILVNMAVFWGPQRIETQAQERAERFYLASRLPALELPAFVAWLEDTKSPRAAMATSLQDGGQLGELLEGMEHEPSFLARLRAGQVVTPAHPQYLQWMQERQQYEHLQPASFTQRWSQNHGKDSEFRPLTWITSAFLHANTGHLLGNMLFLFLFGFSVELALGRGTYLAFYLIGAVGASLLAGWAYVGTGGYGLGASGAVSALMGMYAVMYRLKRIRFFYQLFFYFNYVTAPALILLPAWLANELLQHLFGGEGVAYMAHLGGLLTGAALMAGNLYFRKLPLLASPAAATVDGFDDHVAAARRRAGEMKFESACVEWRAAAKLRPGDADTLRSWFNTARLWPAGEDFHRAAHCIFRLAPHDPATLELQHASYRTYLDQAKPGARLKPDDMARLAGRFTRARQFNDAEKLCQALIKAAPDHPGLGNTLSLCANGLLQAGHRDRALQWLPHLLRLAPQDMVTRALQNA